MRKSRQAWALGLFLLSAVAIIFALESSAIRLRGGDSDILASPASHISELESAAPQSSMPSAMPMYSQSMGLEEEDAGADVIGALASQPSVVESDVPSPLTEANVPAPEMPTSVADMPTPLDDEPQSATVESNIASNAPTSQQPSSIVVSKVMSNGLASPAIRSTPAFASRMSKLSAMPNIGSLPPKMPNSKVTKPESGVPVALLPSTAYLITHEINYGTPNPKLRPRCSKILKEIGRSSQKNRESFAFSAYETIIGLLSDANLSKDKDFEGDKIIRTSMDVMRSSGGGRALEWHYIVSLRNCAVDEHGRTIFMKLIEKGYLTSFLNPEFRKGVVVSQIRDTLNNNILHLAVMSKNVTVVETVLDLIGNGNTLVIMSKPNIEGKMPVDLAIALKLDDITSMLKQRYSMAHAILQLQSHHDNTSAALLKAQQNAVKSSI